MSNIFIFESKTIMWKREKEGGTGRRRGRRGRGGKTEERAPSLSQSPQASFSKNMSPSTHSGVQTSHIELVAARIQVIS